LATLNNTPDLYAYVGTSSRQFGLLTVYGTNPPAAPPTSLIGAFCVKQFTPVRVMVLHWVTTCVYVNPLDGVNNPGASVDNATIEPAVKSTSYVEHVGDFDGFVVGDRVVGGVGDLDGRRVGAFDGKRVGDLLGLSVGAPVIVNGAIVAETLQDMVWHIQSVMSDDEQGRFAPVIIRPSKIFSLFVQNPPEYVKSPTVPDPAWLWKLKWLALEQVSI
jgi:hypothetical protein